MKRLLVCLGALVALAAGSTQAAAYPVTVTDNEVLVFNTPDTNQASCVGCVITMSFDFTGTQLIITVDNVSVAPELAATLGALGFNATPNLTNGTLGGFFGNGAWQINYNANGGGLGGTWEVLSDAVANNKMGVNSPVGTITFSYTGTSLQIDDALVHIQTITNPAGSTKFVCCTEGEGQNEAEGQGPEPASLLLFGMALSAAGVRMRRARA